MLQKVQIWSFLRLFLQCCILTTCLRNFGSRSATLEIPKTGLNILRSITVVDSESWISGFIDPRHLALGDILSHAFCQQQQRSPTKCLSAKAAIVPLRCKKTQICVVLSSILCQVVLLLTTVSSTYGTVHLVYQHPTTRFHKTVREKNIP